MTIRVRCHACRTAYLVPEELTGKRVGCPKCGARQIAEPAPLAGQDESKPAVAAQASKVETRKVVTPPSKPAPAAESVFVPSDEKRKPRKFRPLPWIILAALGSLAMGLVVAWPAIRNWWHPVPPDPVESVAKAFLQSLIKKDAEATQRLSTVEIPPGIRSVRSVKRDRARDTRNKGSFAPITVFHNKLNETHTYNPETGRYQPKNLLGPAAETLEALHDAKAKIEQEGIAKKIEAGSPDDLFDAAEGLGKTMAALAEGVLAPKKLIPSYKQLLDDAKPPLPPDERALVLDYDAHRATWDALLKRPFTTLKADGPYLLERAEVTASVMDSLASSGDPTTTLHLTLTRFRLEGIDTGWKVTETRRAERGVETKDALSTTKGPEKSSPGEPAKAPPRVYDRPSP